MPLLEAFAVLSSIAYVILAARGSIWCWPSALVSVIAYTVICLQANLLAESLLQVFYGIMAVYGWVNWIKGKKPDESIQIQTWPIKYHLINIGASTLGWVGLALILESNTNAALPWLDAFTTVFSITATFLVTRKVLSNWIYWIIIDAAGIYLYASRGLYLTAVLFIAFTIIAAYGYFKWLKIHQLQDEY